MRNELPSEFEVGLLGGLRLKIPDLRAEVPVEGKGKTWLANLYSESCRLVIEGSSRKIAHRGRRNQGIQHVEKFHSTLLKLIDIKSNNSGIRPVMLWQDLIPATSNDLKLCSKWGVYVFSHRQFRIEDVLEDRAVSDVNKQALKFLARLNSDVKPRWSWLREEERRDLLAALGKRAMTGREICERMGLEYNRANLAKVHDLMKGMLGDGQVKKLVQGFARGQGGIFGTNSSQLIELEPKLFPTYRPDKRRNRLAMWILWLISEEPGLNYVMIVRRLHERWKILAERQEVVGIIHGNLIKKGLVQVEGNQHPLKFVATRSDEKHNPS